MTTIGERIKKVRQGEHLTQQEFADRISVKRNTVATYEMGRSTPNDSALALICREFQVNEAWLRTGKGDMFQPEAESLLLEDASLDEFDRAILQSYIKAPKELRTHIRKMVFDAAEKARHASPSIDEKAEAEAPAKPPAPAEASARFTEEEMAAYRKVRAAMEKEAEARGEKPAVPPKPDGLTDEEWAMVQQKRTAKEFREEEAG